MKLDLNIIPADREAMIDIAPLERAIRQLRETRESCGLRSELGRKIKRTLNAIAKRLVRVSQFNLRVLLKCEMLETESWRARVLDDLGGADALERWDTRKAKADATILAPRIIPFTESDDDFGIKPKPKDTTPTRETVNIPGINGVELKSTCCQTDRDGLFRLAPIRHIIRPDTVQEEVARWEAKSWRWAMQPFPKAKRSKTDKPETFKPIPLTPDEFRSVPFPPTSGGGEPSVVRFGGGKSTKSAWVDSPPPSCATLITPSPEVGGKYFSRMEHHNNPPPPKSRSPD